MLPMLRAGDRLVVSYRREIRPGGIVVARFADGTLAVKRAAQRRTTAGGLPAWWLLSDNAEEGVDSRHRGPVPQDQVVAVVVGRLWPRPRVATRRW